MKTLASMLMLAAVSFAAAPNYRVTGKIQIGGEGGWDYVTVDSAARRLYVSHSTLVEVIDLDTEKVVGQIPDTQGVHGIAIASKLGRGFTSNGRANNVTIFDLKTLKPIGKVETGQNPDAIYYDDASGRVFTFNGRSGNATAINAASGKVEGTIPLDGKPEFATGDGKGNVYVNIEDKSELSVIDSKKLSVTKTYALTGCEEPSGLAMDVAHRRLFSVCGNKVMAVSDPDAGKVVATLPTGAGTDGAGFDAKRGLAFASNGRDATLTVAGLVAGKYAVVQNAATQNGARTIAVDAKTHKVYLPTAQYGPAPAGQKGRSRPPVLPGSFVVLVIGE
jgi:DNA-binding beta-propeller fold protein YncE